MFHLSWFTSMRPHGWGPGGAAPWSGNDIDPAAWQDGSVLLDLARALDRSGFDYMMLEDHVAHEPLPGIEPRIDPFPLMPLIASVTTGLGVIATMSTSFYSPYMLARLVLSADHLSHGRVGWNIVTTSENYAAQANGTGDSQPLHDERYDRADEFTDLVKALWNGWDADAINSTDSTRPYVDLTKLHPVTVDGRWFTSTNGLLNVSRSAQGRPVLSQAGSSPRGREFGARHADTVLVSTDGANSVEAMKEVRDDIRARTEAAGRNPDEVKVMYLVTPIIGRTDDEAKELFDLKFGADDARIAQVLRLVGTHANVDMSGWDYDRPMPYVDPLTVQGHRGSFELFAAHSDGGRRTIREMVTQYKTSSLDLWGTPTTVADRMEEVMEGVGGDGFLIFCNPLTRHYITEITDGLVPELQKRGLVRKRYAHSTLRENLLEF